jgi:hypothetical protein
MRVTAPLEYRIWQRLEPLINEEETVISATSES